VAQPPKSPPHSPAQLPATPAVKPATNPAAVLVDPPRPELRPLPSGYDVRQLATLLIAAVLLDGRALDDTIATAFARADFRQMEPRDKGLARMIAATVLRRQGQLDAIIMNFVDRSLPIKSGNLRPILYSAAAQLLILKIAPHAVINIAVEQCRRDPAANRFDKLANAVLRKVATQGPALLATQNVATLNIPEWLWKRWITTYGEPLATRIAEASLTEAALDITVKGDAAGWAERLSGHLLPTGSVRLLPEGRIEHLAGFADGDWWVQDAAAALPVKLLGEVKGLRVADLCAAPGGKTAELAALGADVTAVDISADRLLRVRDNLHRLQLRARTVEADAATWSPPEEFDAVLVDVPCTATGTIRRHPDILRLKRQEDLRKLADVQARLLRNAMRLVKPGGLVVFCSCSLEPEEGPDQIARLLEASPGIVRVPVSAAELGGGSAADWISPAGDLRTLPQHLPNDNPELAGMDGFFAARLKWLD
jgi:16S rRNA (cytosine967-C5)-methyltransferase